MVQGLGIGFSGLEFKCVGPGGGGGEGSWLLRLEGCRVLACWVCGFSLFEFRVLGFGRGVVKGFGVLGSLGTGVRDLGFKLQGVQG